MTAVQVAPKIRSCHFCVNAIDDIDYTDNRTLQRFVSSYGKIAPRRRTGTCVGHQRDLMHAIKRARFMALMPFTSR
jgi:small subunit ribosomal protein S18